MPKPYKTRVDKGVRRSACVSVTCPCGSVFEVQPSRVGRKKYCSLDCKRAYATRPSGLTYQKHKDNPTSFKPGQRTSPETEFKPGERPWNAGMQTADPDSWMASRIPGYYALHQQLRRERGSASTYSCSLLDATCDGPMQWSNISQEYLGTHDFRPLCMSHHLRYDRSK